MPKDNHALLRHLPSVNRLLVLAEGEGLIARHGRPATVRAARAELDGLRRALVDGACDPPDDAALMDAVARRLAAEARRALQPVINATGIIVHTNLGRAPLPPEAVAAVGGVAAGYSNLEFDLESGRRGSRYDGILDTIRTLTGAEAALVVNNNAAAVLLALSALAAGGEAVVSRGELVEIGGSFRIPDIIQQGGARLVEVGTTNRTRVADYTNALGPETRLILKVHQSNYRIVGFTEAPVLADLVKLGRGHGVPVMEDLGSGTLMDLGPFGIPDEPTVASSIAAGVDVVTFSGDKLLGGPQAGLAVGRRDLIDRMRRHPLLRALRPDKMTLAALGAVLRLYEDGAHPPVARMMAEPLDAVAQRARRLCGMLPAGAGADVVDSEAYVGGGALPDRALPSSAVRLAVADAEAVARTLRRASPPVVARVRDGAAWLDARTLADADLPAVAAAVAEALS
ncbi:L-seryl-tRNA(Sec) selenium transferase [Caenispirillum salinarum AK4]|uniref:L-seryl-tRNA(Sec) selenium transferase n=1 Tax=Caenispirillum salinarum AK4 TaxID=1238182 RepID=K9GSE8_9PROT|nr:L-seryl-tRNA(Sec) selenium transferase [Caenispirillum salinarum]EKV28920.1 L-seryl-tRNA(Sec) selenium transferase [Caenispirillum salinarum AK4]